jgi:hypothetical protein
LSRIQLAKVQVAAQDPVDLSDLYLYGFVALENAVVIAAEHFGIATQKTHPSKAHAAEELHAKHGMTDVSSLLRDLNELRKAEEYGETRPATTMTPEFIATAVEDFVNSVGALFDT